MLSLVVFLVTQSSVNLKQTFIERLRSWEARFECTAINYKVLNVRTPTKLTLHLWPGDEHLTQNGSMLEAYSNGSFYRLVKSGRGRTRRIAVSYGSSSRSQVKSMLASMRQVLFNVGAMYEGDTGMSKALEDGLIVVATSGATSKVSFTPRPQSGKEKFKRGILTLIWKDRSEIPSTITYSFNTGKVTHEILRQSTGPLSLLVKSTIVVGGKPQASTLQVSLEPLSKKRPCILIPRPGDEVLDETYGILYTQGDSRTFDESLAKRTLAAAERSTPVDVQAQRGLLCGVDTLYYICQLTGARTSESRLRGLLPESSVRGASLLELKNAASKIDIQLVGRDFSPTDLRNSKTPCILALRNAHFAVYVPTNKHYTIIDPPYSVRVLSEADLNLLWTGKALMVNK